ncbi:unnamed protein product [Amoebophrya sp. A120]|nr:unnamed protein product [Amoebophrya sp. A120]|eukprot:GSA120T00021526001.1
MYTRTSSSSTRAGRGDPEVERQHKSYSSRHIQESASTFRRDEAAQKSQSVVLLAPSTTSRATSSTSTKLVSSGRGRRDDVDTVQEPSSQASAPLLVLPPVVLENEPEKQNGNKEEEETTLLEQTHLLKSSTGGFFSERTQRDDEDEGRNTATRSCSGNKEETRKNVDPAGAEQKRGARGSSREQGGSTSWLDRFCFGDMQIAEHDPDNLWFDEPRHFVRNYPLILAFCRLVGTLSYACGIFIVGITSENFLPKAYAAYLTRVNVLVSFVYYLLLFWRQQRLYRKACSASTLAFCVRQEQQAGAATLLHEINSDGENEISYDAERGAAKGTAPYDVVDLQSSQKSALFLPETGNHDMPMNSNIIQERRRSKETPRPQQRLRSGSVEPTTVKTFRDDEEKDLILGATHHEDDLQHDKKNSSVRNTLSSCRPRASHQLAEQACQAAHEMVEQDEVELQIPARRQDFFMQLRIQSHENSSLTKVIRVLQEWIIIVSLLICVVYWAALHRASEFDYISSNFYVRNKVSQEGSFAAQRITVENLQEIELLTEMRNLVQQYHGKAKAAAVSDLLLLQPTAFYPTAVEYESRAYTEYNPLDANFMRERVRDTLAEFMRKQNFDDGQSSGDVIEQPGPEPPLFSRSPAGPSPWATSNVVLDFSDVAPPSASEASPLSQQGPRRSSQHRGQRGPPGGSSASRGGGQGGSTNTRQQRSFNAAALRQRREKMLGALLKRIATVHAHLQLVVDENYSNTNPPLLPGEEPIEDLTRQDIRQRFNVARKIVLEYIKLYDNNSDKDQAQQKYPLAKKLFDSSKAKRRTAFTLTVLEHGFIVFASLTELLLVQQRFRWGRCFLLITMLVLYAFVNMIWTFVQGYAIYPHLLDWRQAPAVAVAVVVALAVLFSGIYWLLICTHNPPGSRGSCCGGRKNKEPNQASETTSGHVDSTTRLEENIEYDGREQATAASCNMRVEHRGSKHEQGCYDKRGDSASASFKRHHSTDPFSGPHSVTEIDQEDELDRTSTKNFPLAPPRFETDREPLLV